MPFFNPTTGREIAFEGPTYQRLLKERYTEESLKKRPSTKDLEKVKKSKSRSKSISKDKKSKSKSKSKSGECKPSTLKKYTSRPSPPFPGNACCGQKRKGNDDREYESVPDKNGVCKWKLLKPTVVKMTKKPSLKNKKLPEMSSIDRHNLKHHPWMFS